MPPWVWYVHLMYPRVWYVHLMYLRVGISCSSSSGWVSPALAHQGGLPPCVGTSGGVTSVCWYLRVYNDGYPTVYNDGYPTVYNGGYPTVHNGRYPTVHNGGYSRFVQRWFIPG